MLQYPFLAYLAFSPDPPYELVAWLQCFFLALLFFYPDTPSDLVDGQQCFVLAPVVFLQGNGKHVDGLLHYVLAFVPDVLVHLASAVLTVVPFGFSSVSLLETQHEM